MIFSLHRKLSNSTNRIQFIRFIPVVSQNKEESEDDEYALSENWTFQQTNRRWSRVGEMEMEKPTLEKLAKALNTSRESSPEQNDLNDDGLAFSTLPLGISIAQTQADPNELPVRLRRTGSERLKDGAKALLRRVESIKTRRRKRQNRDGIVIHSPNTLDLSQIGSKANGDLKCIITTYSTPPSPAPNNTYAANLFANKPGQELKVHITTDYGTSMEKLNPHLLSPRHYTTLPLNNYHSNRAASPTTHFFPANAGLAKDLKGSGDDSSPYYSDASQESSGTGGGGIIISTIPKKRPSRTRRFLQKGGSKIEDIGALSDSECQQMFTRNRKVFQGEMHLTPHTPNTVEPETKASKFSRGGSLNLGKDSSRFKETFKSRSFRSRSSARVKPDGEFDYKIRTR